jgi:ABC-type nitrate/sulfonate/bicarbonate transport system ATPase subunit
MIQVDHAEFCFSGAEKPFIKMSDVALDWTATGTLAGASGIGKTTMFRLLAGWYAPDGAKCKFRLPLTSFENVRYIGVHPSLLPWKTVQDNLQMRFPSYPLSSLMMLLDELGLPENVAALYPYQLSFGMYKRVELIAAAECSPRLLLLDEFYSSIADTQKEMVASYLRRRLADATIWIIAHEKSLRTWVSGPEYRLRVHDKTIVGIERV